MFDLTKLTPEEKEKRNSLYLEYGKVRASAMVEYKEYITPSLLAYQKKDEEAWKRVIEQEAPYREKILAFDSYLDSLYHIEGIKRV